MYLSFYRLSEKPFQINTEPGFLWLGETHDEALSVLKYGLMNRSGILLLTGDVGTGKTTLVNALLQSLDDDVVAGKIVHSKIDLLGFLNLVGQAFGFPVRFSKIDAFVSYFNQFLRKQYLEGRHVLLVVDEAQKLSPKILEQARLLSNVTMAGENLVSIFLVGQNELNSNLLSRQCRALRQRITIHHQLKPLSLTETTQYCKHRLGLAGGRSEIFDPHAIKEIHKHARGYPRLINIICERALIAGYVKGQAVIAPEVIAECARELLLPGETAFGSEPASTRERQAAFDGDEISPQSRARAPYQLSKKQAKQVQDSPAARSVDRPVIRLSLSRNEKFGRTDTAIEKRADLPCAKNRNHKDAQNAPEHKAVLKSGLRAVVSRCMNSGVGNTALAVGSVCLALAFSIWYQGIAQSQSSDNFSNTLSIQSIQATRNGLRYLTETDRFDTDKDDAYAGKQFIEPRLAETVSPDTATKPGGSGFFDRKAKPAAEKKMTGQLLPVNAVHKIDKLNVGAAEDRAALKVTPEAGLPKKNPAEVAFPSGKTRVAGQSEAGKSGPPQSLSRRSKNAYVLQVGAFLIKGNATRRLETLMDRGYPATIVNFIDARGRNWYTVRLGAYASFDIAARQADDFTKKEKMDSIVRPVDRF